MRRLMAGHSGRRLDGSIGGEHGGSASAAEAGHRGGNRRSDDDTMAESASESLTPLSFFFENCADDDPIVALDLFRLVSDAAFNCRPIERPEAIRTSILLAHKSFLLS